MYPCFSSGDFVLVKKRKHPRLNQIAVVEHPDLGTLIKRVCHFDELGNMQLAGDNAYSTNSESMGWVSTDFLVGTVVFSLRQRD